MALGQRLAAGRFPPGLCETRQRRIEREVSSRLCASRQDSGAELKP